MNDIDVFFNPKTIAIIGASESPKFGRGMTQYLLNSKFKTFPVNIDKKLIFGHKTYANINDIEEDIDLAVILVRNAFVLQVVEDCVKKNVKGVIIESAGFSETQNDSFDEIQRKIARITYEEEIRIIGPNCVGVTNFSNNFTTTEIDFNEIVEGGKISVIAQSGVLGNVFVDWTSSHKIGLNKVITLGNKVDVDEIDILDYLEVDDETRVIVLYLEGVKRGKEFIKRMKTISKPVLIMKNGRSNIGSKAIKSHTASIAGNDKIYEGIFNQSPAGFRVDNFYEMFDIANVFALQCLPKGKNMAILTSSGSLGALACDMIEEWNLDLARLNDDTVNELESITPEWVSVSNPVDLGPSSFMTFKPSINLIMSDPNVDALLNIFAVPKIPLQRYSISITPQLREMKRLSFTTEKPIINCVYGARWVLDKFLNASNRYSLPIMTRIDHAVKAFKLMFEYGKLLAQSDSTMHIE